MTRHEKDVFLDEVASETEADARRGKISFVFLAMRIITGNDLSSLQTPVDRSDGYKCSGVEEILEHGLHHSLVREHTRAI